MSLHYLNPDREPRECPMCKGTGLNHRFTGAPCNYCPNSTGRLGVESAQPDIEIIFDGQVYWFRRPGEVVGWPRDCFDTEKEALEVARAYYASE